MARAVDKGDMAHKNPLPSTLVFEHVGLTRAKRPKVARTGLLIDQLKYLRVRVPELDRDVTLKLVPARQQGAVSVFSEGGVSGTTL
jgi:hypothetical protein